MSLFSLWVMAFGLSMDAFAVSICKGLAMEKFQWCGALKAGLYFGLFQAVMPLIGFLLGVQFSEYITDYDHWVAFFLLALIGVNMLRESLSDEDDEDFCSNDFNFKTMMTLGFATSIDALAVGVTFAFLSVDIYSSVVTIGLITAALSIIGVKSGHFLGKKIKTKAEILGGLILIGLGVKILLEHTLFG
ncbi:manganese efflux pump MntP [Basfia succiniciproducens]|uniref:manganese efflux pump MntP n=1 Tax=Basfia succiniciproducens TaxID=653940 RepID=UPI003FCD0B9A